MGMESMFPSKLCCMRKPTPLSTAKEGNTACDLPLGVLVHLLCNLACPVAVSPQSRAWSPRQLLSAICGKGYEPCCPIYSNLKIEEDILSGRVLGALVKTRAFSTKELF